MKPAEFHRIDMETWPRREHYEYYKNLVKTSYNLTAYVYISKLLFRCNETKQRFYPTFVYAITKAVNEIKLQAISDLSAQREVHIYPVVESDIEYLTDAGEKISAKELNEYGLYLKIEDTYTATEISLKPQK